jgi:hypothetical protein
MSFARLLPLVDNRKEESMRRYIGLDVHRESAQVAVWEDGRVRHAGQINTIPEALRLFVDSLRCRESRVGKEHSQPALLFVVRDGPRVAAVEVMWRHWERRRPSTATLGG